MHSTVLVANPLSGFVDRFTSDRNSSDEGSSLVLVPVQY